MKKFPLIFRVLLFILCILLLPNVAYARLKVQKGTATIANGQTTVTQNITAVAGLDKAFLLMWSTGDNGTDYGSAFQASGAFTSTSQLQFTRAGTRDDCQIAYYVIEAENNEFTVVERGEITIAINNLTQDKDIAQAVDQTRSFILATPRIGADITNDDNNEKGYATVHFVDNDTIRATRGTSGTATTLVQYAVIQWSTNSGVSVQTGAYSGTIEATQLTSTITTAVDTSHTWLYASFYHTSSGLSQTAIDTYLVNGTTVGFKRYTGSATSGIRWWAIQFPANKVSVQRDNSYDTPNKADLAEVITFPTAVDIAYSWSDVYFDSNGTGQAFPRQSWYSQITSTTQVTNTRFYGGQEAHLSTQLINTKAWLNIPVATANAVSTSSVAAGETDALILDLNLDNTANVVDLTINSITVDNVGTAADGEISAVKLYIDSNNSNDYTSGVDQQVGSGTFTSGSKTFSGLNITLPASGSEDIYVILDLADTVTDGNTLDVRIPVNGITYMAGFSSPAAELNSSGTRTIDLVLDHFVIGHDAAANAGIAEAVTVTAKDNKGNIISDYTGTITLDTNGSGDIAWAKTAGSGVFNDGGVDNDTATYAFDASDNGTATFTITDLLAETINISVSGDAKTDDNTEGDLVVSPGALDHFVISHDNEAVAGVSESVEVTAKDAEENTITDYTGTITLDTDGTADTITWSHVSGGGVFNDGGASVDTATYAFDASDNGTATFAVSDTTTDDLNISAAGDGKNDDDTEGTLVVLPGAINYFVISHDNNAIAAIAETVTITAKDQYGNIKTNYTGTITLDTTGTPSTITWALSAGAGVFNDGGASVDTATYAFNAADDGGVTLTVTDTKTETINISVSGDTKTDDNTEGDLTVAPGAIENFVISHDGQGVTDLAEAVTVTAKDASGNTKTDYNGTITVDTDGSGDIVWAKVTGNGVFNDGGAANDTATYAYDASDSGVVVLTITDDSAEDLNIAVSGDGKSDDDTEGALSIASSGLDHFVITHDGNAIAGTAESVTIAAKNANGDTIDTYQGTINIDTNGTASTITWANVSGNGSFADGGAGVDTATYTFDLTDSGVVGLTITDSTEETINISVTAGSKSDDNTEGNLIINPAGLHHFTLAHDGAAAAGVPDTVTITAKDANGGTATSYTGQITVDTNGTASAITWAKQTGQGSFADGGAGVDTATYTFVAGDNGQCVLTISDTKVETINISAAGDGKSDDDTEGTIVVGPGAINYFKISHDGTAVAGVADNVTITAYDAYDNTKTNYTGQITVDTNGTASAITWANVSGVGSFADGGAGVDTATYTYVAGDSGVVILTINDTKKETINIQVSGDTKTDDDTEGNLVVAAGSIGYFVVSHDGAASAGIAENITITAYDAYNNLKNDYTGQITVDTNGTASAITWANVSGVGSFADGGAGVDTATYTYVSGDNGIVTLSLTDTVAETIDVDAEDGAYTDDDTESNLVIAAGGIDYFVVIHDGQAVVDSFEPIIVTAKDQYGNTVTNYTGQITASTLNETGEITWSLAVGNGTFADGGAGVDTATYTYTTNDLGVVTLNVKDNAADTNIDIEISGSGKTDDDSESALAFTSDSIIIDNVDTNPTPPKYEDVGSNWSTRTGGTFYGTDWRRNVVDSGGQYAYWTPNITVTGNYEVSITYRTGGFASNAPYTVFYEGGNETIPVDQTTLGGPTYFHVLGTYKFVAGTTGYVRLENSADANVCADACKFVLKGSASASANAVTTDSIAAGDSNKLVLNVLVNNNTVNNDTITSVTVNNAGTASDAEIASVKLFYDSDNSGTFNSAVDQQVGSGTFASGAKTFSGLNISLAGNGNEYLFAAVDIATAIDDGDTVDISIPANGLVLANAPEIEPTALNSDGTRTVVIGLDHFVISHDTAAVAGVADNVTVTAKDQYGNTKKSYTGTITLDTNGAGNIIWALSSGAGVFNDGGAGVDTATYTFNVSDNGTAGFTITDEKAETINIAVSAAGKSDDNTEGDLIVAAGNLDHFVISHDTAAVAGTAENITITAKDAYENTVSGYTGQITLDTVSGSVDDITWVLLTGFGTFLDGGAGVDTATYTFNASDNSSATFTIIDTMAESLNISVTGDGKADNDAEGTLVVAAADLDHFVITHDGAASAGVADNVTVTAKDQYGNTKKSYTGTITLDTNGTATTITWAKVTGNGVFSDGGVSVDTATYTYDASDNGVVVLSVADTKIEDLNISVSGDTKADDDTEGTLNIGPGAIEYFTITHDGFSLQNAAENILIKAYDVYNNLKTDYAGQITVDTNGDVDGITWAKVTGSGVFNDGGTGVDTATYTFDGADNGEVTLSITDTTAEIINIAVAGDGKSDDDNEGVLEVVAAGFHHFRIAHDGKGVAGVAEQITITAQDVSNDTVTNYTGTMTVDTNGTAAAIAWGLNTGSGSFADGGAGVDTATYTFHADDNGVVILTVTDANQETINISASGSGKTDDNTEGNLVVYPAGINHFTITHDGQAQAGTAENVAVTAHDANDSAVTDYTGTITLDTTGTAGTITWANISGQGTFNDGGAAVDTATYGFVSADNGTVTLSLNDTKAETLNISVSGDGKTDDDTEGNLAVSPANLDYFLITHDGAASAGVADNVTIRAKDAYNNTITNYTGQITVDTSGTATTITWAKVTGNGVFNDGGGDVDTATYTFALSDNGVVTLSVNDTTMESLNISVSGDGKTDNNTEGLLVVGAGSIDHFIIAHDNSGIAGVAESVTVTAYDVYNNIKTNYTGTITLDTNGTATTITWAKVTGNGVFNDGGAGVDTATYAYVTSDSGQAVFTITDTKAETIDVDVSGSGKFDTDSEGNMAISPAPLHHFTVVHDANAVAGQAEDIAVYARDFYNNNQTGYEGTITLDTTGTADTITWALSAGGGSFADGGAGVDTATYTFSLADSGAATFTISDNTAETINILISGDSKFDDDTEGNLVVSPAALSYFVIGHDGTAVQSVAEEITVTAKDQYANTKTNYTGQVTLDTNGDEMNISWALTSGLGSFADGGASADTASYTFALADGGVAVFEITDDTAQTINISVNDGGITDNNTEGDLTVQASSVTVDGTANALSSQYVGNGATGKLILDVTLTNNNVMATDTLQSVTVNNAGTIADAQISAVKIYYDSNNSSSYSPGVDTQIGSGTFGSGTKTFSNLNVQISTAGTQRIFIVVDLASSLTNAATVDVSIPAGGLIFTNAPEAENTVLNSSGNLTVDSVAAGNAGSLISSSHANTINSWNDPQSRDNTIQVSWSPAADAGSGVDGYSILWDTSPTTVPDAVKDIEQTVTSNTSTARGDGTAHYFHIRSVDNVGNWASDAVHIGPFYIDASGPSPASIYQIAEYAGGDYLYVSGSTMYYSGLGYAAFKVYVAAQDAGSGLKEAVFPALTTAGGTDSTEDGGAYQYVYGYEISSAGSNYADINVQVVDIAGNISYVPFNVLLDNTPPASVASLSSTTHTPNVSSSDNDITLIWADVSDGQSGVAGYSIIINTSADSMPPKYRNVNTGTETYTFNNLANGTYYAHIRPVDNVGNWSNTATHAGPYIIGRGALSASLTTSKSVVSTDQQFTVTMTVQNTGSSTINSVDPSALTVNATGGASANTSSDPSAQNIDASGQQQYQWTYTAGAAAGTVNLQGYAQGTDAEGTITSATVKSPDVIVEKKATLGAAVSASPSTVNTSEIITVVVTLTNTGDADALNVAPSLVPSGSANPTTDQGPTPASATIKGGRPQEFIYKTHGTGSGVATFTANIATGTDENSNANLTATNAQDSVTVQTPPSFALTSSLSASPQAVDIAGTITVAMSVQNTGGSALNGVTPSGLTIGGTSSDAIYVSGPVPASVSTLAAGATQDFTWTYTAGTTLGTVNFTGNTTAAEVSSSNSSSNNITIQADAAALTSSLSASPNAVLTTGTIAVTMSVQNTAAANGATANNVTPSLLTLGGTSGKANKLTGPVPASANIAAGSNQDFVWTYRAGTTAGTVNFTGNAGGLDANAGTEVSSTSNSSNNVSISTLNEDWKYPSGTNVTGPVRSLPIAYDDKIYFGSDDSNMYALNGSTKELDFSYTSSGAIRGMPFPDTEGGKDIVYFGTLGKTVIGVWEDNTVKWEKVMGVPLSTTVVYDYVSKVFFGASDQNVYGLDASDGNIAWTHSGVSIGGSVESSPAIVYVPILSFDVVYMGASDGKIYGFNTADGTWQLTYDTGFGAEGAIETAPFIGAKGGNTYVYFGTANGRFYALNTSDLSLDSDWSSNPVVTGGAIYSAPWVDTDTGYVYFGCRDGKLYALSVANGSSKANFPVDIGSAIDCWPLAWNGIVYFGADDGKFYAVDAATGQIVPGWPYDTDGPIKSGVSLQYIDEDNIYVMIGSDSGKIYSFKVVQ